MIQQKELKNLQKVQLHILTVFRNFCAEHCINYFLIGGTLLGAIRHSGFIPWDDDVDVGMSRDQFDKFYELAKKNFNSEYFIQTLESDPSFERPHLKIRLNNTKSVQIGNSWTNQHHGISISIFPFDIVSARKISRCVQYIQFKIIIKLIYHNRAEYTLVRDFSRKNPLKLLYALTATLISKRFSRITLSRALNNTLKKYAALNNSGYLFPFATCYKYRKHLIKSLWIKDLCEVKFENHTFKAPGHYHEYLVNLYGDYMKLPPEGQRCAKHDIIEINFGNFFEE